MVRVADFPPAQREIAQGGLWDAPHGQLSGSVILPNGAKYQLEPIVRDLVRELKLYVRGFRIAIWRVRPCAALALVPVLRRVNAASVWLNDRWAREECVHAVNLSNARLVIVTHEADIRWIPKHIGVLSIGAVPDFKLLLVRPPCPSVELAPAVASDEMIYFTSGTGGSPKGARLPHAAMDVQAMDKIQRLPFQNATYLHLASHFHVGGASSTLAALHAGATHVIITPGSLLRRASEVLECVRTHRVTILVLVPSVLRALVHAAATSGGTYPGIQALLVGGGGVDARLADAARKVFPRAFGLGTYGMTEACSTMALTTLGASTYYSTPSFDLAVTASKPGLRGRVLVRGSAMMRGYLGSPMLHSTEWHETGDVGVVSARGALSIIGRIRDEIRSGGETVDAGEVERVLGAHAAVDEAAVLGIADDALGEAVVAAVALCASVSTADLAAHCRSTLARYKCPRHFFVLPAIPKCDLGKVQRHAVRQVVEAAIRSQVHPPMAKL